MSPITEYRNGTASYRPPMPLLKGFSGSKNLIWLNDS